ARLERRGAIWLALAALVSAPVMIALGVLAFFPYHGLRAAHVPGDVVVALHLAACAALALRWRPRDATPSSLRHAALALVLYHLALIAALAVHGDAPRAPWKLA